ncbi:MAG: hypothetical protein NVSMB15_06410 [Steroidobacteraceae bacterium]
MNSALVTVTAPETGAPAKVVRVPGTPRATVALFSDGRVYYSPDGFNLAGGGSSIAASGGRLKVLDVVAVGAGVDAQLSDGSVYFSPDGQNLDGGGATVRAFPGTAQVASLTAVAGGVDAVFAHGGGAFYSPDGRNLQGAGATVRIYAGRSDILQIVPVGTGEAVVTLMQNGSAYFSANNRDIGGGGTTIAAAPAAHSQLKALLKVGGGTLAEFADGSVYLSPDGKNLAGGGSTISIPQWNASPANGPFAPRDSAPGTAFAGRLWLSGGYSSPTNSNSCWTTCSFFDLWSSADLSGTTWNQAPSFRTATTPTPRDDSAVANFGVTDVPAPTDFYEAYSPLVVWNQRLFAIGSSVWSSADGHQWARQTRADGVTPVPGPLPFRATENSRALPLGSSLIYVQPDTGHVYSSTDPHAAVWNDLGTIPGFTPRCGAAVFVLQAKIWIEGGGACDYSQLFNDVWSSADGVSWNHATQAVDWTARMWPCVAPASDGVVWLVGGYAPVDWTLSGGTVTVLAGINHGDVWYSKDGANWKQFKADFNSGLPDGNTFEPRHAATCFAVPGSNADTHSLVVMGGTGAADYDDANARVLNSIRTLPLPPAAELP